MSSDYASSQEAVVLPVRMVGIVKRFPGVLANDHVDFQAAAGEVHALLGENGAGKSTLTSILSGLYAPDEGETYIFGEKVRFRSPGDATAHGIGMVHQHFMLVEMHTVSENIILGSDQPSLFINHREIEAEVKKLSEEYGLHVDPSARIWQLSVGEQQRVEILKMLYRGARILILDEPTAVLTPQEVERLFATLRRMTGEGKTVIFISHKLDEVMSISDRITVLRGGRVVATVRREETSPPELAKMMVGREVLFRVAKEDAEPDEVVLDVQGLCANNDKGLPALRGLSFMVRSGEILGIAGVAGNGQRELAEVITGLRKATAGRVSVLDRDVTNCSPRRIIEERVGHIPEDRLGMGLVPNLPISDNVIIKSYREQPISSGPFLRASAIAEFARKLIDRFQIATPNLRTPVRLLSGGNLQKTLLAREISIGPRLMVAMHPTRGLDVGATEAVRQLLLRQRQEGAALLLISEDLDEILELSDRVAVIYEGEIQGILPVTDVDVETIGLLMAGVEPVRVKGVAGERA